jgi:EpsI family protein
VIAPHATIQATQVQPQLETIIPQEFADWKIDSISQLRLVNPDITGKPDKIYDQALARTYINSAGQRIMLSIAYGSNQSTDLHVHRPEICYAAGGFSISGTSKTWLQTPVGSIPVMHLVATQGTRNEPITYWIRVGDTLTRGWLEQKFTAIAYGLTGKIPDGLLFRVSSISRNESDSFHLQQKFLTDLILAMHQQDRYWLLGKLSGVGNPESAPDAGISSNAKN